MIKIINFYFIVVIILHNYAMDSVVSSEQKHKAKKNRIGKKIVVGCVGGALGALVCYFKQYNRKITVPIILGGVGIGVLLEALIYRRSKPKNSEQDNALFIALNKIYPEPTFYIHHTEIPTDLILADHENDDESEPFNKLCCATSLLSSLNAQGIFISYINNILNKDKAINMEKLLELVKEKPGSGRELTPIKNFRENILDYNKPSYTVWSWEQAALEIKRDEGNAFKSERSDNFFKVFDYLFAEALVNEGEAQTVLFKMLYREVVLQYKWSHGWGESQHKYLLRNIAFIKIFIFIKAIQNTVNIAPIFYLFPWAIMAEIFYFIILCSLEDKIIIGVNTDVEKKHICYILYYWLDITNLYYDPKLYKFFSNLIQQYQKEWSLELTDFLHETDCSRFQSLNLKVEEV
jgi:hypothetical protein